jgi:heavy metal sensor kinase
LRIRSIRARLTVWYIMVLTISFLVLGGTAYGLLTYSLSHELNNALKGAATLLAERARSGGPRLVPSDLDKIFRRFLGFSPWEPYFQMRDPFGRRELRSPDKSSAQLPLSEEARRNAARGIPTFETVEGLRDYPVRLLTLPVMQGGRPIRLVQVGMSLQNILEARSRFLLIMAAVFPFALLLAGLGGWLSARRALAPVDHMAETANRISAEHLTQRIQETGAEDELDRLAKTLNEMLERLDAAFTQIRRFSADASHELQTPLTILKGELEVALRSSRTPEEYQATLRSALEEIDRIASLVEGLLVLARAEAGALRVDRQPLDLAQLAEEVYWQVKGLADSRSIELQMTPTAPLIFRGDRERLRRLLLNLLDNGIKHTPPGGRVALTLQVCGEWACLRVADTGVGIAPQDRDRIFQPFYRAPEALSERGVGLGLAIARSIALAHGGAIRVQSEPGRGSQFDVRLPCGV